MDAGLKDRCRRYGVLENWVIVSTVDVKRPNVAQLLLIQLEEPHH